jgi:putative phosphoribosyl transferase
MWFADRADAGRRLALRLRHLRDDGTVVLAVPGGGVAVAYEIARALAAPLDAAMVAPLTLPISAGQVLGAVGEGGIRVADDGVIQAAPAAVRQELAATERRAHAELERRAERYRAGRPRVRAGGRTAIVVDDGAVTGFTSMAACLVARARGAAAVVLALPVAPAGVVRWLAGTADEVVCLQAPPVLMAVGDWYEDFEGLGDARIVDLLTRAALPAGADGEPRRNGGPSPSGMPTPV